MDRRKSSYDKSKNRRKSSAAEKSKESEKEKYEWKDEDLDEEMEEIFHPAKDHFSLADLIGTTEVEEKRRFDENDYELHRRESFQYHQPLRKLYHKYKKAPHRNESVEIQPKSSISEEPVSTPSQDKEAASENELLIPDSNIQNAEISRPAQMQSAEGEKVQFYVGSSSSLENTIDPSKSRTSEKVPLKSVLRGFLKQGKRTSDGLSPSINLPSSSKTSIEENVLATSFTDTALDMPAGESPLPVPVSLDVMKPKVKFMLGEESREEIRKASIESAKINHVKHPRRHSVRRKHHGFNIDAKCYNTVLEPEEAETLHSADIDCMASHRFEDPKGIRRHKIQDKNSVASFFKAKKDDLVSPYKKEYDHEPHELFVELQELQEHEYSDDLEWRQTARWIKYEEDVELGSDRWGKPHVPPLVFRSLLNLRKYLEGGAVLVDVEEKDMVGIAKRIADCMVQTDQIKPEQKDVVLRTLMLRHRHVNEKAVPYLRRNSSGYGNLNLLGHDKSRSPSFLKSIRSKQESVTNALNNQDRTPLETTILMPNSNNINNVEITPSSKRKSVSYDKFMDQGILRRIPENAEGVAVLVGKLDELNEPASVFMRLAEGQQIPHFLEVPINVRFIFVLLGPRTSSLDYHEVGRALGSLMNNQDFHVSAYKAANKKDLIHAINSFLDLSTVVPPGKWERQSLLPIDEIRRKSLVKVHKIEDVKKELPEKPIYDPLRRTGRIFGGFIKDIRHRFIWFKSDIFDGLNMQSVASVIFIYFAAISGAIAFGGLLADKTELKIGVSETLIGTAICGILFSLLAGQPLIIIGTTGPLLLFDEVLFQLREHYTCDFLVMRAWIGIWTAVIATIVVAAEGSALVKFFSRFVQEIFATIISLLFIVESFTKLYKIFLENPLQQYYCNVSSFNATDNETSVLLSDTPQPNTALLSAILMIGTFYIALFLRHFRNSKFLGRSARRALGDFGVPIGIVIMVLVDYLIPNTYTQKLSVPEGLSPSTERSWFVYPVPVSVGEAAVASVGGLLIFILLFIETQICELIISKKKLKKGSGFHLDMFIIGYMEMISAFIGGPWQCAATVRSISHVSSLIVWSKTHAPGETPHIIEVKEQRLTNFLVSVLVGLSVLMAPVLRQVPVAVLFGVFLYMGISALSGIQLYERFLLIFMPTKHHPDFAFVRKVRTSKMHLYTAIQVLCIAVLWIIKTYIAPAFPFGLLSMVFVHSQIKRLFTKEEIKALDEGGAEDDAQDTEDEPDFYEQIVA